MVCVTAAGLTLWRENNLSKISLCTVHCLMRVRTCKPRTWLYGCSLGHICWMWAQVCFVASSDRFCRGYCADLVNSSLAVGSPYSFHSATWSKFNSYTTHHAVSYVKQVRYRQHHCSVIIYTCSSNWTARHSSLAHLPCLALRLNSHHASRRCSYFLKFFYWQTVMNVYHR